MRLLSRAIKFAVICFSVSACVTSTEPSGSVREGYLGYIKANHFKAFAATAVHSGGGAAAWGYASNRPSAKEAVAEALYKCKQGQSKYSAATNCSVLYVGNKAVMDTPEKDVNSLADQYQSTPAQFD
jgi:hypothetical protein